MNKKDIATKNQCYNNNELAYYLFYFTALYFTQLNIGTTSSTFNTGIATGIFTRTSPQKKGWGSLK